MNDLKPTFEHYYPTGTKGPGTGLLAGECAVFCQHLVNMPLVGNTLQTKTAAVTKSGILAFKLGGKFLPGDVLILDVGTKAGHVAIVNKVIDGTLRLSESNWNLDKKVSHDRTMPANSKQIVGIFRSTLKVKIINPGVEITPMFPIKMTMKIFANHNSWTHLPESIAEFVTELKNRSGGRLELAIDVELTEFENIPSEVYDSIQYKNYVPDPNNLTGPPIWDGTYSLPVDRKGFARTFMDQLALESKAYDFVMLFVPTSEWPDNTSRGWRTDNDQGPVELQVCGDELEFESFAIGAYGNGFINRALHELGHGLFMYTGQGDTVHFHAYEDKQFNKIYEELNYNQLIKSLELNRKENQQEGKSDMITFEYNGTFFVPVFRKFVPIADENTFLELGGDWSSVKKLSEAEYNSIIVPFLATQTILK